MREGFKTITFEGIGTHWWIDIQSSVSAGLTSEIEKALLEILYDFDQKYSRFKADSLILELNRLKTLTGFPVELFDMLKLSDKVREITDGHFDVCVGSHLENLGYDAKYSFENKEKKLNSENLKLLELTKHKIEISDDVIVDLGGIGKGWLIEKFRQRLEEFNLAKFVVNGGGDIYVKDSEGKEYEFALENPFDNSEMIGTIKISNEAIACSSPSRRAWLDKKQNKIHHHLIDFKTGESAKEIISVFTQSKKIVSADLASTAIFVSEPEKAESIAKALEVEYLIVFPNAKYFKSKGYKGQLN